MNGRTAKLIRRASRAYGIPVKDIKRLWYNMNRHERTEARQEMKADVARYQEKRSKMETRSPKTNSRKVREAVPQPRDPSPSRTEQTAAGSYDPPSRWRLFFGWLKAWIAWLIPTNN